MKWFFTWLIGVSLNDSSVFTRTQCLIVTLLYIWKILIYIQTLTNNNFCCWDQLFYRMFILFICFCCFIFSVYFVASVVSFLSYFLFLRICLTIEELSRKCPVVSDRDFIIGPLLPITTLYYTHRISFSALRGVTFL